MKMPFRKIYGRDILAAILTVAGISNLFVAQTILFTGVGLVIGFLPRLAMYSSERETQKRLSLILFCIYLFFTLWMSDFQEISRVKSFMTVTATAALYQISLYLMLIFFEKDRAINEVPIN